MSTFVTVYGVARVRHLEGAEPLFTHYSYGTDEAPLSYVR